MCVRGIWGLSMAKEQRGLIGQRVRKKGDRFKNTCFGVKDTPFKGMKDGVSLGTVAGGRESSREGEGGSSDTFCTLNVDPCTILPQEPNRQSRK